VRVRTDYCRAHVGAMESTAEQESTRMLAKPRVALGLLKSTLSACLKDNVQRMSAALAYYTIFSLAPLLVIAIAIAGLVFGEDAARGEIVGEIQELVGQDGAKAIQTMIQSAYHPGHSAIATIIGIVTLLVGATGAFSEVYDALNLIWRVNQESNTGVRTMIKARFMSFGMILIIGFLLLVSLVVSAVLAGISKYASSFLPAPAALLHFLDFLFSLAVVTVLFAMIFKVLPEMKIRWGDVWAGASLTALLFTVGKFAIGFYVGKSVSTSSYGAAGSLVVVVAWIYYSAFILYFGAEFTQVYAHQCGSRLAGTRPQRN
jgi:membrane protein